MPFPAPRIPPESKRLARQWTQPGIEARIYHLRRLIAKGLYEDVDVSRGVGLAVTQACGRRDDRCELEAIWHFMHGVGQDGLPNVRYTGDIDQRDTFQSARVTLGYRGGDCDDGDVLIATLAGGNGFRVKSRITVNPGGDGWAHIYPLVGFPKQNPVQWVPMDWTLGYHAFMRHPPFDRYVEFDGKRIVYSPGEIKPGEYQGW